MAENEHFERINILLSVIQNGILMNCKTTTELEKLTCEHVITTIRIHKKSL